MPVLSELVVQITGDTSGLDNAARAGSKAVSGFALTIQQRAIPSLTGLATKAGLAAGAIIGVNSAAGFVGWGIKIAADAETAEVAFTTLLKSGDKAKELLADLKNFAARTPLQLGELRDATRMLLAFGVVQDDVLPTLRRIGDVASLTGNSIGELAEIYGKAKVQGRLFAEDINQLQGRGVNVSEQFAKQLGVTTEELRKMVEQGKVSFSNLEKAFIDMTSAGGDFFGGMEAQSKTLAGMFSTLKDVFSNLVLSVSKELVPALKEIVTDTTSWIQSIEQADIESFAKDLGEAAKQAAELARFMSKVAGFVAKVSIANPTNFYSAQAETLRTFIAEGKRNKILDAQLKEIKQRKPVSDVEYRKSLETDPQMQLAEPVASAPLTLGPAAKSVAGMLNRGIESIGVASEMVGAKYTELSKKLAAMKPPDIPEKSVTLASNEAALFGTMEAQRIINAQMVGGGMEDIARKQLKTLEDIADNTKASKPAVGPQLAVVPAL